ncbi:MAG: hypothetical protein KF726_25890 [Anaerolineae bacterium]|nr:hypothetical protein [Anaerolineae bacterium]
MKLKRRDLLFIWLSALAVLLYAFVAMQRSAGRFPLDDSWIHQTYARNLALTGRWEYVPGVPSAGSTSPLYTVLLATGYMLRLPYLLWTHFLGALALALGGIVGARIADRLFPSVKRAGLWTGLALVLSWHLVWAATSGMETMLFGALCLCVIALAYRQIDTRPDLSRFGEGVAFGMVGAILIATRPEGSLLLLIIGGIMLLARPQGSWRGLLLWYAGAALGGGIGLTPYALLNLSLNGSLLPNTFSAKQMQGSLLAAQGFFYNLARMLEPMSAGGQLLLLPGAVWFVVKQARPFQRINLLYLIPLLWSAALILLFVIRLPAPYQHGRYIIPALPTFIVIGVGATVQLVSRRYRGMIGRVAVRTLGFTTMGIFVLFFVIGATTFATDVQLIESDMVVAAQWLAQNIPADQLLAVHDIGAVGYFAPRPILDIAGLITPETIPYYYDPDNMLRLMQERGARYLMVLPTQMYPQWQPYVCERFNAQGGMGGMTIYEFEIAGKC